MPRQRRVVIANCAHHITQRGNNRRAVFSSDQDRELFLALLKEYSDAHQVEVTGYCLMTNHVHVVATPHTADGLAKALGRTHNDYARLQNIRRRECGHLWQSRFFSCPVEARYLWAVLAYVERNPVRAGMVSAPENWRWSSARAHLGGARGSESWLSLAEWERHWTADLWRVVLHDGLAEGELRARLAEATATGRPLGGAEFVKTCEQHSGRVLRRQKPGPKVRSAAVGGNLELR